MGFVVIFVIAVIVGAVLWYLQTVAATKRRRRMSEVAMKHGLSFSAKDPFNMPATVPLAFFDRGHARLDLYPSVAAQGAHALLHGALRNCGCSRPAEDQRADRFVQKQQFVNSHASLVTQLPAELATRALVKLRRIQIILRKPNFA